MTKEQWLALSKEEKSQRLASRLPYGALYIGTCEHGNSAIEHQYAIGDGITRRIVDKEQAQ